LSTDKAVSLHTHFSTTILTTSTTGLLHAIIDKLKSEFKIKDMGPLKPFLAVQIQCSSTGFFHSQEQYAEDLLDRAGMGDCKLAPTLVDTNGKLPASTGETIDNPSEYGSLVDALQYLTVTSIMSSSKHVFTCTIRAPAILH
jgi:hypothetical protein